MYELIIPPCLEKEAKKAFPDMIYLGMKITVNKILPDDGWVLITKENRNDRTNERTRNDERISGVGERREV